MTEFGLATTYGSVVFCTTLVPAFAYFVNFGVKEARPALTEDEIAQNKSLKRIFMRDMGFICAGLALFYIFFANQSINITETVFMGVLFVVYIITVVLMSSSKSEDSKTGKDAVKSKHSDEEEAETT
jgi:Ca2+/Na+ antiporter